MKLIIIILMGLLSCPAILSRPHCGSFNNHDDKVTITFYDDNAGKIYSMTDIKLVNCGKEYPATSVHSNINDGHATVTLTFPHMTRFSNPKVKLKINGKKATFKVCQ